MIRATRILALSIGLLTVCWVLASDTGLLLRRGEEALRSGDVVAAIKAFRGARESSPDAWEAHDGLGRAWRAAGDLEAAQRQLQRAVERAAGNATPALHLLELLPVLPDLEIRRHGFRWLAENGATDAKVQLPVARESRRAGDLETAAVALHRLLAAEPDHREARIEQILVVRDSLDYLRAEQLALGLMERHPGYAQTYAQLGRIYRMQDRLPQAAAQLERALELAPDSARAMTWLGEIRMAQGRLDDAVTLLRAAVNVAPDRYQAHYILGQAYLRQGDGEAAAKELQIFRELKDALRAQTRLAGGAAMEDD
jgi:tetratricopeptide (TPR) repeat protein